MKRLKLQTKFAVFMPLLIIINLISFLHSRSLSEIIKNLPGPGYIMPAFSIPAPLDPKDKAYLKLGDKSAFNPSELKVPLLLIEVLNVYCASCQRMRPYMNELFDRIEKDPELKDKIKLIGICAGNDKWAVELEKDSYRFPIIPDADYDFHDLAGQPPTPFLLFVRPYDNGSLMVVYSHLGSTKNAGELFSIMQAAIKNAGVLSTQQIRAAKDKDSVSRAEVPVPVSDEVLMKKIRQSLTLNGEEPGNLKKIMLPGEGIIYAGEIKSGRKVFAVVVARKIPCADCHDAFFIYSFDKEGNFLNFVPISISKFGNIKWDDQDVHKIKDHLEGKSLLNKIPFNSKVDGVTSATISSELVFDSINKTKAIIVKLAKDGYIREEK